MTPPWQLSYLDQLLLDGLMTPATTAIAASRASAELPVPLGSWLPFFYNDKKRTFVVLPALGKPRRDGGPSGPLRYYPELARAIHQAESLDGAQVRSWVDALDLSSLSPAQRQDLDQRLYLAFPEEAPPPPPGGSPPPYTPGEAAQVKALFSGC